MRITPHDIRQQQFTVRMFRGFNPHHRKDRSYYPLLAHVAQTGHILRLKNRPGNVHDSKQSAAFLRELRAASADSISRSTAAAPAAAAPFNISI